MKIVCATDLLPRSEAATERAGLLAVQLRADLTLLHVVVTGDYQRAQPPLWRAQSAANVTVRAGNPARIILDTVEQSRARLLVLGAHRKRPLRDAFESTIAEKALASKHCPVLIVQDEARGSYRRVLLALDSSDASATAVRAAESLVLAPNADAKVVHAYEPPYEGMPHYAEGWRRAAISSVRDLLEYESAHPARYDIHVEPQPAAAGIQRAIERFEPDLLVMGTYGGGRLRRALLGSVANRVLHQSRCDVLIAPEGAFGFARSKQLFGIRFPLESAKQPSLQGCLRRASASAGGPRQVTGDSPAGQEVSTFP